MPTPTETNWAPARRAAGLERLEAFLPRAAAYAQQRNFDRPGHPDVSRLSPWIRHRLLTEREVCQQVLARHPYGRVEKFIQEVAWRTYWKGWLELRPQVWQRYRDELEQATARLQEEQGAWGLDQLARAEAGESGIECFDHWARELVETGYLHNHARMWFASVWIFTLRLPWSLGADFFYRHLLDGDPASNTLSWRWVAGLQTRGKNYVARAGNIAKFTEGRFRPRAGQLRDDPPPLEEDGPPPARRDLPPDGWPSGGGRLGLLLTPDDLAPERSPLAGLTTQAVAAGWADEVGQRYELSPQVVAFKRGALEDGLARAGAHYRVPADELGEHAAGWRGAVVDWVARHQLDEVVTLATPIGPWQELLDLVEAELSERGCRLLRARRPWDDSLWPKATAGFFKFKKDLQLTVAGLCNE